jgi:hypothetical protein
MCTPVQHNLYMTYVTYNVVLTFFLSAVSYNTLPKMYQDDYTPPPLLYTSFTECHKKKQGVSMCVIAAIVVVFFALSLKPPSMKMYQPSIVSQCAAGLTTITTAVKEKLSARKTITVTPRPSAPVTNDDDDDEEDEDEDEE